MLIIRKEQIKILARPNLERFEKRLRAKLAEDYPRERATLGEQAFAEVIAYGVGRALEHGFETEHDLTRFLYLMFTFGRDFDTAPEFPWVQETLKIPGDPSLRMDRLYHRAGQHEEEGWGLLPPPA